MSGNRVKREDWLPKREDWAEFDNVVYEEVGGFTGLQEAERNLRKLCASGVVRAIRFHEDGVEFIPPGEWKRANFDTDGVYLSTKDLLQNWIELQNKPLPQTGKQPRIKALLSEMYPEGVPDPAHCPRKALKADLLKRDPSLNPLDEATLKSAIEAYNSDPKRSDRLHSD
jgi:hypothetical protein